MPDGVLRAELDDDEVILNPETGVYHLLNGSAKKLMESLDAGETLDQAIDSMASTSGANAQRVREDCEAFIHAMLQRGLLEESS
jgi:hypothetical protein